MDLTMKKVFLLAAYANLKSYKINLALQKLRISRDGYPTTSLGNLSWCLSTLAVKVLFLMFKWNFLWFSLCPWPLVLSLGTTGKSAALSSVHHPFGQC